jgi:hypothetical protein
MRRADLRPVHPARLARQDEPAFGMLQKNAAAILRPSGRVFVLTSGVFGSH